MKSNIQCYDRSMLTKEEEQTGTLLQGLAEVRPQETPESRLVRMMTDGGERQVEQGILDRVQATSPSRGSVQTVRMDRRTLKALKDAAFDRGISQQEIILNALRKDLGLDQS